MDLKLFRFHLGKIKNHKELKHIPMPHSVRSYGEVLAKIRSEHWIIQRVHFWMYAYDRTHKWTNRDWQYEINEKAWEKAKEKRKERAQRKKEYRLRKQNKPINTDYSHLASWDEVSGKGLQKALKQLGVSSFNELLKDSCE